MPAGALTTASAAASRRWTNAAPPRASTRPCIASTSPRSSSRPSPDGMSDAPLPATRSRLPNPPTGEVVELDLSTNAGLAAFRDWLSELKRQIDSVLVDVDADLT